jgi:ceramide glucosyltransferase
MTFTALAILISVLLMVEIAINHRQLRRAIASARQGNRPLREYPSISVIRPVRGADVGAADNFRAALDNGYPGEIETFFVFDEESDPGYAIACQVVEEHRAHGRKGCAEVLVAGHPPKGMTGKLHAMVFGERHARHELVAFGDSDTRPDQDVLRITVETLLERADAGCAFAPVVVNHAAERAGDVGYAMLINSWYGPSVALTTRKTGGDVPFIMGQLMVFRRATLRDIGGVACARGQLVDDMAIGVHVTRAGWRNIMAPHPLYIATGGMTLGEFVRLFHRWLLFSRNGLPRSFTWPMWVRGVEFWIAAATLILSLYHLHFWVALAPALALAAFDRSLIALGQDFGGAPLRGVHKLVPLIIPALGPALAAYSLVHKRVEWRGRAYDLDAAARLA